MTENAARCYDVILFDLGYTLIYFEPKQEELVQEAVRATGAERSLEKVRDATRNVWSAYYRNAAHAVFPATEEYDRQVELARSRDLLAALDIKGEGALACYRTALEAAFDRPGTLQLYPEVREVLDRLKAEGYRLGIVSNWSWNLRDRVVQVGLDGYFELVWASAYAGCNKPHPAIFQQALDQMTVPPERALYVGDSYDHDVTGARTAGLDVLLVDRAQGGEGRDCPVIVDLFGVLDFLAGC